MKKIQLITLIQFFLTVFLSSAQTINYPYGIMPTNANFEDAKAIYDIWVAENVNNNYCPNKNTMLRVGTGSKTTNEYMGHGMINVAMFDSTDERLKKMFNYVKHYHNGNYMMKWLIESGTAKSPNSATDGVVDVITACIIASRKWPNSGVVDFNGNLDWAGVANKKLNSLKRQKGTDNLRLPYYSLSGIPWGGGTDQKYYLNYLPYAMFESFVGITGDTDWFRMKEGSYGLLEFSWDNYVFPAWYVGNFGMGQDPNEPWDANQDRWWSGAARTGWRLPQAYLWTGDQRALQWAQRINDVYVETGKVNEGVSDSLGWGYYYTNGEKQPPGTGQNVFMVGAAGISAMAAGNQIGADNCWNWLVNNYDQSVGKDLKTMLHIIYLGVMCGAFDCSIPDNLPDFEPSTLDLSNSSMIFESSADNQSLTVNTNQDWLVVNSSSWINVTPDSAGTGQSINISVDQNNMGIDRTTMIYFCGYNVPNQYLQITQRKSGGTGAPKIIYQAEDGEFYSNENVTVSTSINGYNGTGLTTSEKGGEYGFVKWNVFLSEFATTADLKIRYAAGGDKGVEILFNEHTADRFTLTKTFSGTGENWDEFVISDINLLPGVNTIKIQGAKHLHLDQIELVPGNPIQTYNLTTSATNGSVSPESGTYSEGAVVTLTATADLDYSFSNWSGDASGTDNPIDITMDNNKNITAEFVYDPKPKYDLTITAENGNVSPGSGTYNEGDVLNLMATPNNGFIFDSWSGDTNSNSNPLTLVINKNMNITANFITVPTHSLTVNNGSGTGDYEHGEIISIEADAAPVGYLFEKWTGDVATVNDIFAKSTTVTVNNDITISASYSEIDDLILQAEDADIIESATIETTISGYNGTGYVHFGGGAYLEFTGVDVGEGTFDVIVRSTEEWADASDLIVNGNSYPFELPGTSGDWAETTISNVSFQATGNTIQINDGKQQNIDQIKIIGILTSKNEIAEADKGIDIYPNPLGKERIIYLTKNADVIVYDNKGIPVLKHINTSKINMDGFKPGLYIVKTGAAINKIIVK
jgi:hypothetical protein